MGKKHRRTLSGRRYGGPYSGGGRRAGGRHTCGITAAWPYASLRAKATAALALSL